MRNPRRRPDTRTVKDQKQVVVRMPLAMHEQLTEAARKHRRSVNGHLLYLIEQHVEPQEAKAA